MESREKPDEIVEVSFGNLAEKARRRELKRKRKRSDCGQTRSSSERGEINDKG